MDDEPTATTTTTTTAKPKPKGKNAAGIKGKVCLSTCPDTILYQLTMIQWQAPQKYVSCDC